MTTKSTIEVVTELHDAENRYMAALDRLTDSAQKSKENFNSEHFSTWRCSASTSYVDSFEMNVAMADVVRAAAEVKMASDCVRLVETRLEMDRLKS